MLLYDSMYRFLTAVWFAELFLKIYLIVLFWFAKKCYKCTIFFVFVLYCPSYILREKCPVFLYSLTDFRVGGLH